jgi:hypothetical protein
MLMNRLSAALRQLDEERHRAEFYRMWLVALRAGFTHPKSMETMGVRQSGRTESARRWLLDGTSRGRDLTSLVQSGGDRFDDFERALITLGEESGGLEEIVRQLGMFFNRKHKLMLWVRKKMAYPVFTAMAACFVAPVPLLYFGHASAYVICVVTGCVILLFSAETIVTAVAACKRRHHCLLCRCNNVLFSCQYFTRCLSALPITFCGLPPAPSPEAAGC